AMLAIAPFDLSGEGRQLGLFSDESNLAETERALARAQALLGPDQVLQGRPQGGRLPGERVSWSRWGEEPAKPDRDPSAPWPGATPSPSPALVLDRATPLEIEWDGGMPSRVRPGSRCGPGPPWSRPGRLTGQGWQGRPAAARYQVGTSVGAILCGVSNGRAFLTAVHGCAFGFLPHVAAGEGGGGPSGPRGRGPQGRKEDTVDPWLASLAPPPGLRPYSPVPLPLHGGEVHGRSAESGSLVRSAAPRGREVTSRDRGSAHQWRASLARWGFLLVATAPYLPPPLRLRRQGPSPFCLRLRGGTKLGSEGRFASHGRDPVGDQVLHPVAACGDVGLTHSLCGDSRVHHDPDRAATGPRLTGRERLVAAMDGQGEDGQTRCDRHREGPLLEGPHEAVAG